MLLFTLQMMGDSEKDENIKKKVLIVTLSKLEILLVTLMHKLPGKKQ